MLMLEREEDVVSRGGPVLARARAGACGLRPHGLARRLGRGAAPAGAGTADAARRARACGRRTSTPWSPAPPARGAGDRLEAELLQAVFGETPLPAVLAPKSITGEYGGGHLGAAVLAAGGGEFAATAGFAEADPALRLRPHDGGRLAAGRVLATSLAAGGASAWLVLEQP